MGYQKYDDDMLQQIEENVDLLSYIEREIPLKRQGNDFFGHCPLHTDKTPSFSVTPDKNKFFCFSCGRGGGIINYLKEYEGRRFDEAVEQAAKLAHVDLSTMCQSETVMFLKRLKRWSQDKHEPFEHPILPEAEYAQYIKEEIPEWLDEGIQQKALDVFDIRVDESSNRIVYPVRDIKGRLINIKARTRYKNFKDLRIPKYINYHEVGVMDYFQSLDMALPAVKEKNEVIIFESVKSVMKAYGWGYRNCVSAEKHTLTPEQVTLLARLHANIVFAYDSDINYNQPDVKKDIDKLKFITNVYVINDPYKLLGGEIAKNAPADCGQQVWEELYARKRKVV